MSRPKGGPSEAFSKRESKTRLKRPQWELQVAELFPANRGFGSLQSMTSTPEQAAQDRLELAIEIARKAGGETLKWFRNSSLEVERKGDGSPVTAADQAAERLLRDEIAERFPDDGIVGEEYGETLGTSAYRWVLDPIDGTKSFISGVPLYTTLVAVMEENEPLIGVIYAPATEEMLFARTGGKAVYAVGKAPAQQVRVSEVSSLSEATFLTTSVPAFDKDRDPADRAAYQRLESACRLSRTWGDAYGYLLVATGRAEIMVDPALNLWDAACLQPIIEAAGGVYTGWNGEPSVHCGDAIATNAVLAEAARALLVE
ncbi:histidinol-phosphatase [Adhaeretor mobilis]|uniref:Histidinol-phosphatase n=1 Tax=Adhaeretor mobilis TaxID=1930276 RepID=A0A517MXR2_9BACT|nr:histidinol-phosphatase [Adhaeretor mobilis]QDS99666.1 Histidinol-phosphatase [Adhaeretor mobilis]